MRNRKQPSWLQTASKGKKRVLAAVCILLVLGVLSPFVINGIVVGSARRYILEPQETEQVNADCVIALGAMVWGKDTLSHMLEDRVLGAIDVYERGGAKKILMSGDHGQEDYDEVNAMKKYAVEKGVAADDVFTTLAFVTLDANGDREFAFARKPGADTQLRFDELDLSLIDETRVFHFGTLSLTGEPARTTTYRAVEYAKAHGKLVTYDPNLRKPLWRSLDEAKEQILWGLRQADVVKISDEEVEFLFGLGVQDGAQYILDHYPVKLVFVTCGADGCWFQNRNAGGHVDSLKDIKVVDTTGAGDIFGGSAVWKLLQTGKRPEDLDEAELTQIVSFACRAAGLSTTKHGGISSVPDSIS